MNGQAGSCGHTGDHLEQLMLALARNTHVIGVDITKPACTCLAPVNPQSQGSPSDAPSRGFHPQETPASPHEIQHLHIAPI